MKPSPNPPALTMPLEPTPGWLGLSRRVRHRIDDLTHKTAGTPLEQDADLLAKDASKLCDYVEFLHRETNRWLSETSGIEAENRDTSLPRPTADVERAAVSIQQAQHEQSGNTMDFVKALLMWVETPEERVEADVDSASFQHQSPPSQAH